MLLAENGLQARRYLEGSELKKASVEVFVLRRRIRQPKELSCSPNALAEQPIQPTKYCALQAAKCNCDACGQEHQGVQSYAPVQSKHGTSRALRSSAKDI